MPSFGAGSNFPYTFPIVFGVANQAVVIEDTPPLETLFGADMVYGARHTWPSFFQVISRPVFLPDGTGVTAPTKAEPVNTGRDDMTLAPL